MNYFSLFGWDDSSLAVVRCVSDRFPAEQLELSLKDGTDLCMTAGDGLLVDYPPNNLVGAVGLYSTRMKRVLEDFAQNFTWVPVHVDQGQSVHAYFALVAGNVPDVLDETRTIRNRVNGSVIKPIFSREKIRNLHLFVATPESPTPVCSAYVRRLLEAESVQGVVFAKRPIVE